MKRLSDIPLEIAERLDLPAESVAGVPKLTVTGRRRALVENHCGLLEYSHECIVVDGGRLLTADLRELIAEANKAAPELLRRRDAWLEGHKPVNEVGASQDAQAG